MKNDRNEELENKAKEYADKHERRGCSYWNGLYRGYFDALKKQEKLKESLKMQVKVNDELLLTLKEQPNEILTDVRRKLLSMRATREERSKLDAEDRLIQTGYHFCILDMFAWIKEIMK